ncbi:hypothetical protein GX48_02253 [Paracoccidioides brasiliensis]|nr:hypothetical protein GX48_02253 [Paracoccidioides brasiliensis]
MAQGECNCEDKGTARAASNQQTTAVSMTDPVSKSDPDQAVPATPFQYSQKHEKMIKSLTTKISILNSEISKTETLLSEARGKLNPPASNRAGTAGKDKTPIPKDPAAIVQRHIRLLHEYNEIKDIGLGLIGLVAEARGVRHVDALQSFGVGEKD